MSGGLACDMREQSSRRADAIARIAYQGSDGGYQRSGIAPRGKLIPFVVCQGIVISQSRRATITPRPRRGVRLR